MKEAGCGNGIGIEGGERAQGVFMCGWFCEVVSGAVLCGIPYYL